MEDRKLISELENGRKLNVLLVSEEKYFMNLIGLHKIYPNLNIEVLEKIDNYSKIIGEIDNIDIIINYHSKKENLADSNSLEELALKYSLDNNKRVTIGYSYIDPYNEGLDNIILTSYKEKVSEIKQFEIDNDYTPYDLLQITLNEHDELEKVKTLKRS